MCDSFIQETNEKLFLQEQCSVLSFDSGNYTDPTEGRDNHHRHMSSKIRSVSEYGNPPSDHNYPPSGLFPENRRNNLKFVISFVFTFDSCVVSGYLPRSNRSWTASRRTLTDSGVSDSENPGSIQHLYKEK